MTPPTPHPYAQQLRCPYPVRDRAGEVVCYLSREIDGRKAGEALVAALGRHFEVRVRGEAFR